MDLTDVNRTSTPKYGNGLRGKLPDGTSVSIRRGSTTGPATMDIGLKDGRYIGTKIRYGEYSRMNLEQYTKTAKNVLESILYYSKFNTL